MTNNKKLPGKNDHYVEHNRTWITAANGPRKTMQVTLVECDVDDTDRFSYFNGSWWKFAPPHDGW